jgi:2-(1,2-epoxy-1,2-dihydrophenyl)acetyl-CoA isomerase
MGDTILVERTGGVATVTFNRPQKKNAITTGLLDELDAALDAAVRDHTVRVLVLTGAGGDFSSGADLTDRGGPGGGSQTPFLLHMRRLGDAILRIHRFSKPTIAAVDGVAVGMGMNMALACDLVIATDRARFCEIFPRRGMAIDGGGSWILPRLVGLHKAKELAFFGDMVPAADAMAMGLVNRVVPVADLPAAVGEWAGRLAAGPTVALSLTKGMLNNAMTVSVDQALEDEARSQHITFSTQDLKEALAAFVDKREPSFTGR